MTDSSLPISNHEKDVDGLRVRIEEFDDKLEDLRNNSFQALATVASAAALNDASRRAKLTSNVQAVNTVTQDAESALTDAKLLLRNASLAVDETRAATSEICQYPLKITFLNY